MFAFHVMGQEAELPYNEWISKLSIKNDLLSKNYNEVVADLIKIDTPQYCNVFSKLRAKAPANNRRLQLRLKLIEGTIHTYKNLKSPCPGSKPPEDLFNEALNIAYEIEDDLITFQICRRLTSYHTDHANYGKGVLYGFLAQELFDRLEKDKAFPMSPTLHNLAHCLYHSREYSASKDVLVKLLNVKSTELLPEDTMNRVYNMFAWNTLGLAYTKLGKPDSAFMAFDSALVIATQEHNPFWTSIINGNKGDIYFQQEQYDSAEIRLSYDYEGSIAAKEFDNAANSLQWLARIDLIRGKSTAALQKTREAERLLLQTYQPSYMANTWFTYTKVFASLGKADSVSLYLDKFLTLHDSIEQEASEARAENVLMRLESQENIHTIKSLNREKKKVVLVRNFTITLILLCALIGFMILNRQKLQLKVRRQEALEAKRIAENEALLAKEQLNHFTRNLIEKTTMLETLQTQLSVKEMSEEQSQQIAELSHHAILTEDDWENFKKLFEKVYPGFFYNLKQKAADLTAADQRMAALCKLHISNREAATLLGIAPNSVIKARQRLRHRLGLEPEADLELYFAQAKEFN